MIDVLIVGSGGAGLTAALNAKKEGAEVLVISKTYPTHSQTCQAQGGINAVINEDEQDNNKNYIDDTYKASHKLGNKSTIELFCKSSKNTIEWLDSIGVPFSRTNSNNIAQRKFGGTKAKRTCFSSDYTGLKILHTLYDQCIKENIKFLNEHQLINLIIEDNKIKGVTALNIINSEIKEIYSKTVILATGGYSGIYHQYTSNSFASTGDGIAAAYRAGAKLSNMEFVQFHPTTLENKNILISESARGEGGYLINQDGNRFIEELKPRDEVARAIYKRTHKGEKVFLDLTHLGLNKINEVMPQEQRLVKDFMNLNMESDLIPITPSAHYSMGGILTNIKTETSIKNLYSCGECSQSGIHGANRLGGNSLLEIICFGKIAGINATNEAKKIEHYIPPTNKQIEKDKKTIQEILTRENKLDFYKTKKELGKLFFNNVGLFREEKKLEKAFIYLQKKEKEINSYGIEDKSKTYNKNLAEFLEFQNILQLSKIITKSSIERKESRGAHYRTDFPEEKEEFNKNSISQLKDSLHKIYFEDVL